MKLDAFLERIYEKNYKKLMLVSFGILVLSIAVLAFNYLSTGSIIERDISLKGGISITIEELGLDESEISSYLDAKFENVNVRTLTDLSTRENIGLIIESSSLNEDEIKSALKEKIDF